MEENTVIAFRSPADFQEDPLTEVLRAGAHKLLAQAIEAEVASFLEAYAALVDDAGRRRVVRNGYLPERAIQTGIGLSSARRADVRVTPCIFLTVAARNPRTLCSCQPMARCISARLAPLERCSSERAICFFVSER